VEGASVVERTSSHQIAVRSVAKGGHLAELHSCGGVSRSELTVSFWSSFSGLESLYVGRTWRFWTCVSAWIRLHCIRFLYIFYLLYSTFCFPHI
jgi:hypothetical protein